MRCGGKTTVGASSFYVRYYGYGMVKWSGKWVRRMLVDVYVPASYFSARVACRIYPGRVRLAATPK